MLTGGIALALTSVSRNWIPEKKVKGQESLIKNRAMQLLMFEGCFIGFGWGVFDVAVPAYATQEECSAPRRLDLRLLWYCYRHWRITWWACLKKASTA
jgi:hypothetical protein